MDQNKINEFTAKAKAAGYNDAQIAAEIERKKKELEVERQTKEELADMLWDLEKFYKQYITKLINHKTEQIRKRKKK